jgi:hypothetical protein
MLLDIIEVLKSRSGVNLALVFAEILETFGIKEKVSYQSFNNREEIFT